MKNIAILIIGLIFTNCKAQIVAQDVPLENRGSTEQGYYYKDFNNTLNLFEGTYKYTNGSTSFTIILQKKVQSNYNNYCQEDILIGSYKYVENNITKVDVLNDINNTYSDGWSYYIHGSNILTGNTLGCTDCDINEKWIEGSIEDLVSGSIDTLFIRKVTVNGQEAIKIWIYHQIPMTVVGEDALQAPISYPLGEKLVLLKQ